MLILSNFLLWVIVLLQTIAILALARHLRAGRGGAVPSAAVAVPLFRRAIRRDGAAVPVAEDIARRDGPDLEGQAVLLLHMAHGCPVGQRLVPDARLMARAEGLAFLVACEPPAGGGEASPLALRRSPSGRRRPARGAPLLPCAFVVSAAGAIVAYGEVDSRSDLAMLLASAAGGETAPLRAVGDI